MFNPAWPSEKQEHGQIESLANSLHVWEVLPWFLGQPLTSLPTRRVPSKGPRSPGTPFCRDELAPQAALGSLSQDPASGGRQGSVGPLCLTITDHR